MVWEIYARNRDSGQTRDSLKIYNFFFGQEVFNMEKANFDPVAYWTGMGFPIEMLKVVQGSGGKEAVCEYCGHKVDLFGGCLERHAEGAQHKMRVKTYKINTESKIQAFKTGYPLEAVQELKDDLKRMSGKVVDKEHMETKKRD